MSTNIKELTPEQLAAYQQQLYSGGLLNSYQQGVFLNAPGKILGAEATPTTSSSSKSKGKSSVSIPQYTASIYSNSPGVHIGAAGSAFLGDYLNGLFLNSNEEFAKSIGGELYQDENGIITTRLKLSNGSYFSKETVYNYLTPDHMSSLVNISDLRSLLTSSVSKNKNVNKLGDLNLAFVNALASGKLGTDKFVSSGNMKYATVGGDVTPNTEVYITTNELNDKGQYKSKKADIMNLTTLSITDEYKEAISAVANSFDFTHTEEEIAQHKKEKEAFAEFLAPSWVQKASYATGTILSSAANVGSLWLGYRQFKEDKQRYQEQKERLLREENRQIRSYNSQLGDHISGRGFVNSSSSSLRNLAKNYRDQKFDKADK